MLAFSWWVSKEVLELVENDQAKILWDFKIQTDKLVMANQPEIVLINKQQNMAVVIEVIYIYIDIHIHKYIQYLTKVSTPLTFQQKFL